MRWFIFKNIKVGDQLYFVYNDYDYFYGKVEVIGDGIKSIDILATILKDRKKYKAGEKKKVQVGDCCPWNVFTNRHSQ